MQAQKSKHTQSSRDRGLDIVFRHLGEGVHLLDHLVDSVLPMTQHFQLLALLGTAFKANEQGFVKTEFP